MGALQPWVNPVWSARALRFHRPHPDKGAKRYQVKDARAALAAELAGKSLTGWTEEKLREAATREIEAA